MKKLLYTLAAVATIGLAGCTDVEISSFETNVQVKKVTHIPYRSLRWEKYDSCAQESGSVGEEIYYYYGGGAAIFLDDYNCDGKVDRIYNGLNQVDSFRTQELEDKFLIADQKFKEFKDELNQEVNLNQVYQDWKKGIVDKEDILEGIE